MFSRLKYRNYVIKSLIPFSSGVKVNFSILILISLIFTFISFLTPRLYKIFIDDIIIGRDISLLLKVVILYVLLFLIKTGLTYINAHSENRVVNIVIFKLKHRV